MFVTRKIPLTERDEQKEFLEAVGTVMKICVPGIIDIKKVLGARVPIIKFCNTYTNMQCDLSSTNMYVINIYFSSFWGITIVFKLFVQDCITHVRVVIYIWTIGLAH